jgi:type II restriction enzyme
MRNIAGTLAERKFSRALIATLSIEGRPFSWLNSKSRQWITGSRDDADIEWQLRGLHWQNKRGNRTLIYNLTVPIVGKNVDLCLFNALPEDVKLGRKPNSCHYQPTTYVALGELKGGIDPAGADEHWKTAHAALERIRTAFSAESLSPKTFFIGAAVEKSMAQEIYNQLVSGRLDNAANLTNETQLISVCQWLSEL